MPGAISQSDPTQVDDGTGTPQASLPGESEQNETRQPSTAREADPKEEALVKKRWREYEIARKFDENYRKQIAIDRRYAAGTSDMSWAVTTNVIGSFIDVLTSLLYARDPDVSVKKAPQVNEGGTLPMEQFAKTLEIVISRLWRDGKLRRACKKDVRSVLSVGEGWMKCTMVADKTPMPEVETALNDARETMAMLEAQEKLLEDPQDHDPDTLAAEKDEKIALIEELEDKLEVAVKRMFVIDFCKAESIQVSLDVDNIEDYLDANWIANEIYIEKDDALARFPDLSVEDLKSATLYYQRMPRELTTRDIDNVLPQGVLTAESAESYSTNSSEAESIPFLRVVEQWDRRDKQIRTLIAGVKKWAKMPYAPPYPASRFYPYFYTAFYETDGSRHPQSLSWRLYKLQDEFSCTRSNFRLSRERAIPATMFNATALDDTEARKLQEAKHQEYIALRPSDPATPLSNIFAPKPVSQIDSRLYDTGPIMSDMERVSGVQEALQSSQQKGTPQTATFTNVQQAGTNARTTSDRDALEWMLADLAQYTAEQALQALPTRAVQRIAGEGAFWPFGMDIDDLFTLVEVKITAGSTGKPRSQTDQAAWGVVLPLIEKLVGQIEQARVTDNVPLANALTELVKETMLRMGDDTDTSRFIPQTPPPGSPGAGAPPRAPPAKVSVTLKGEIDPATAKMLVGPTAAMDAATMAQLQPQAPPGGAPPASGGQPGSPPGPVAPIQAPAPGLHPAGA
ncbi:MAG: hypothetical protein ACHP7P_13585 [Terriglobales bacterium]